jgi:hypothetical protein
MVTHAAAMFAVEGAGAALAHIVERARRKPQECGGLSEGKIR